MNSTYKPTYRDLRTNAETITDEVIKERVLKGIEVLTEEYGPDWVDHVDPRTLVMSDCDRCVLGQLYKTEARDTPHSNGFFYGVDHKLHIDPVEYAFATPDTTYDDYGDEVTQYEYTDLDRAWRIAFGADDA